MPAPRIRTRRYMNARLSWALLVLLAAAAWSAAPARSQSAATRTFQPSALPAAAAIDMSGAAALGMGTDIPQRLGVKGRITFRTNKADRAAQRAAAVQERLRGDGQRSRDAATRASANIEAIETLLADVEGDEQRLATEVQSRLVERYKSGDAGDLEYLLSGGSLADVVRHGKLLKDQSARDRRTFEEYQLTVARLEDLRLVLEQLRDINGDQAQRLDARAERLNDTLVAARVGHMEAADAPTPKGAGIDGTWYVMDGAFQAQLYLPSPGSGYDGGTRTPRRPPSMQQIQRVLADPRIDLTASGINDVQTGQIDGRILDALSLAAARFNHVRVTSLKRDHGTLTSSGNVSAHAYGCAADIGTIGSTWITPGSQTPGGEVYQAVLFFSGLGSVQPDLAPHQVISLFDLGGSTLAMGDHGDHIHLGYSC